MKCPVISFEMSVGLVDFGQPVYWGSGFCSCVAGEFVWYVLLWSLLALAWCLVLVYLWRHLMSSNRLMFPGFGSSRVLRFGLKPSASRFQSYSYSSLKASPSHFEDNGLIFWVPNVLCQHSQVVLWNLLRAQMFFRWICWGESRLSVLFLCHLRTASWMLSFKPTFSPSSFTFIKRLFNSSISAIRVVSSTYLRLLIFLPAILIPARASSSTAFHMMYMMMFCI